MRLLVLGGEACMPELVARWATPERRMLNTYGPTEATVVATWAECVPGEAVTIGRALPGYQAYVLDEQLNPVGPGSEGELFIGGAGVALGYLNRPELTAERFIDNPFSYLEGPPDSLYRTHDMVRLTHDGLLQFLGRIDGQVKIRGFRVELSEIEAVLMEYPGVRSATVNVVTAGGLPEVAGYIIVDEAEGALDRAAIAEMLRSRLPEYMVPKYLDVVESMPTLTSGKVDRKQLPAPVNLLKGTDRQYVAPAGDLEQALVAVWEKCFHTSPVSVEDDFFLDLGGHSLLAAQVVTELRRRFGTSRVSVRDIYKNRTVRTLAVRLRDLGVSIGATTEQAAAARCSDRSRAGVRHRAGVGAVAVRRSAGHLRDGHLWPVRRPVRLWRADDGRRDGGEHRPSTPRCGGRPCWASSTGRSCCWLQHRRQMAGDRPLSARPLPGVELLLFPLVAGEPLPAARLVAHVRRHAADGPLLPRHGRQGGPRRD